MRAAAIFLVILSAATSCLGQQLQISGVYTLIIESLALTQISPNSPITASPVESGAVSQAWTVILQAGTATIQSIRTLQFLAPLDDRFVIPSTVPFAWQVLQNNAATSVFCTDGLCITTAGSSVGLLPQGSNDPQNVDVAATTPPPASYQIVNIVTNNIFGAGFVPSPATLTPAPATDRSEIWTASSTGVGSISLVNLDSSGILSVASNKTIGVFTASPPFPWNVIAIQGIGQIVFLNNGVLAVSNGQLVLSNTVQSTAAWVFIPVNATKFLP